MSKFNSKTMSKLNRFGHSVANQLDFGLKHGLIGSSNMDQHSEIREFLRRYKSELSRDYNVNVSNILKTPKQKDFVVSLIECKLDVLMAS